LRFNGRETVEREKRVCLTLKRSRLIHTAALVLEKHAASVGFFSELDVIDFRNGKLRSELARLDTQMLGQRLDIHGLEIDAPVPLLRRAALSAVGLALET
jgi:hypothetical protein